jgi:hypothetical protein
MGARPASTGEQLFARYAYAPNDLGYCGPAETAALFELGVTGRTDTDVTAVARRFSGAWPYAAVLAELAGIANPLDEQVMRAYWTGGALLDEIDREAFGVKLLELIGSRAGHYWGHLTAELLPEAAPTHGFHVFGVYPWTRLLRGGLSGGGLPGGGLPEQALHVLDSCRIRWGEVLGVAGEHVLVRSRPLGWDGQALSLLAERTERVRMCVGGRGFVTDPQPGERLALHWDWVCDRLAADDLACLQRWTDWQLQITNERLRREEVHGR